MLVAETAIALKSVGAVDTRERNKCDAFYGIKILWKIDILEYHLLVSAE